MKPVSVTLVGSSPWDRDIQVNDVNLRPARALAERLDAPYNVIVPAGDAEPGFVDLDPVRLYRVRGDSRLGFLQAARRTIDHGPTARSDVLMSSDPLAAVAAELSHTRRITPHIMQVQETSWTRARSTAERSNAWRSPWSRGRPSAAPPAYAW